MRVRHPIQRRNEEFRDLRDKDKNHQNTKENHLRPTTTNTSSIFVKSTAGVSCACPSNSRTRNSLTAPISSPGGNTPPTPEVSALWTACKFACFDRKFKFNNGATPPVTRSPVTMPCS